VLTVAPVSWLRELGRVQCPITAIGLPSLPVADRYFPRLQLRGSAGFSPASLLVSDDEDARTNNCERAKRMVANLLAGFLKVNAGCAAE